MPTSSQSESAARARIVVIDDDVIVAESIAEHLSAAGFEVATAASGEEGINLIRRAAHRSSEISAQPFAVAIVDLALPGMSGRDLIVALASERLATVPIVITGFGTIESAVDAVRSGAMDYLLKPIVDQELLLAVEKAVSRHALLAENHALKRRLDGRSLFDDIVGDDSRMRRIYDVVEAVAPTRTTVLMTGESGTGKSLIARAIHARSPRSAKPFVELACGSIPETLLESELFGHVKGAFTGAHADKPGRFLAAHGGTIFLDEINSASPAMQLKLLRVLQERRFEPVGSTNTVEVDVRVILATNQPLEELVTTGMFRQDLYYRINVVTILLPPLRERVSDIPALAAHFLASRAREIGKEIIGFTDEAMHVLVGYAYPGNVRELENIIERAVVLTRAPRIAVEDLPSHVTEPSPPRRSGGAAGDSPWRVDRWTPMSLARALEEPERQIILAALEANNWNRQRTADDLQINRTTLYKKIKQYGLEQYGRTG